MNIALRPGKYVVAVSGGVDSMTLLHMLKQMEQSDSRMVVLSNGRGDSRAISPSDDPTIKLIVAHFDHGIRADSAKDRQFVEDVAKDLGLAFEFERAELGPNASEDTARRARYAFLRNVKQKTGAAAIITAHHQDDVLETAIHNLLRGTGRKGLSSLAEQSDIIRPLLDTPKQQIIDYANTRGLKWREDITNQDIGYRRNYIRHKIMPKLSAAQRAQFLEIIASAKKLNDEIDKQLAVLLQSLVTSEGIKRYDFIMLPHAVARELVAAWLRSKEYRDFDQPTLERLVRDAKILASGKQSDVSGNLKLHITKKYIQLKPTAS